MFAIPDRDLREPHDRGLVILRERNFKPSAAAIGFTGVADFLVAVLIHEMAAGVAAVEIPRPVPEPHADAIGVAGRLARAVLRGDEQLHGADLLLGMLLQVSGIVTAHEAGRGLV